MPTRRAGASSCVANRRGFSMSGSKSHGLRCVGLCRERHSAGPDRFRVGRPDSGRERTRTFAAIVVIGERDGAKSSRTGSKIPNHQNPAASRAIQRVLVNVGEQSLPEPPGWQWRESLDNWSLALPPDEPRPYSQQVGGVWGKLVSGISSLTCRENTGNFSRRAGKSPPANTASNLGPASARSNNCWGTPTSERR